MALSTEFLHHSRLGHYSLHAQHTMATHILVSSGVSTLFTASTNAASMFAAAMTGRVLPSDSFHQSESCVPPWRERALDRGVEACDRVRQAQGSAQLTLDPLEEHRDDGRVPTILSAVNTCFT